MSRAPAGSMCAWCSTWLVEPGADAASEPVSHGICRDCIGDFLSLPVTDIYDLGDREVDELAFGLIELDDDGIVRRYNASESRLSGLRADDVVGRSFFEEVAPCTRDTIFQERWEKLRTRGRGREQFTFVFRFRTGYRLVEICALVQGGGNTLVLVRPEENGS